MNRSELDDLVFGNGSSFVKNLRNIVDNRKYTEVEEKLSSYFSEEVYSELGSMLHDLSESLVSKISYSLSKEEKIFLIRSIMADVMLSTTQSLFEFFISELERTNK